MSFVGAIFTPNSLIVNIENRVYNAQSDHPNFDRLKAAFKAGDTEGFIDAFDIRSAVEQYIEGGEIKPSGVAIVGDNVFYNGEPVHNSVVDAIQRMLSEGFEINPMIKFLENLMECPSYNSVKEMWKFIESMGLSITEDGCFLAYKAVDSNFRDKYSGAIDNRPGQKPRHMKRSEVDDNANHHCSKGYHVGALGYAGPGGWYHSEGDKVLICKVNPADVVSVPNDHSCQKLRCCYYEPVGEFQGELKSSVYSGEVGGNYSTYINKKFTPSKVQGDSLLEDNYYIGLYTKMDGSSKQRFFLVEEVNHSNDTYTVCLVEPEENDGQYRTFLMRNLEEVYTWDGETDPDEMEFPLVDYDEVPYDLKGYGPFHDYDKDDEDDEDDEYDSGEAEWPVYW